MRRVCFIYLNNVPAVDYIHFHRDDGGVWGWLMLRMVCEHFAAVRTNHIWILKWNNDAHRPPYHLGSEFASQFGRKKDEKSKWAREK